MDFVKEYFEVDALAENCIATAKLLFAISPILLIGYVLATAREDEEEEQAKKERAAKCCSAK